MNTAVAPAWSAGFSILQGHAIGELRKMEPGGVNSCVCSPPYWGLRDYGIESVVWGGDPSCQHEWTIERVERENRTGLGLKDSAASARGGGHKIGELYTSLPSPFLQNSFRNRC